MGFLSGIGGVVLGKMLDYDVSRKLQHDAQDFAADQFARRHQIQVKDLKAAGLNPVLSSSYGGGASPSSGIASTGPTGNFAVTSAQVEKLKAETMSVEQQANESKARELLLGAQKDTTSALAVKERLDAERKLREFKDVDESDAGKLYGGSVESLPGFLRGPARLGIGSAQKVKTFVKDLYRMARHPYDLAKQGEQHRRLDKRLRESKKRKRKRLDLRKMSINGVPVESISRKRRK